MNTNDPSAALSEILKAVPTPAKLKELLAGIDAKITSAIADLKSTRASRVTMIEMKKHMALLGKKVSDKITGTEGVVTSIGFDLYGCVQAIVNPGNDKDGKARDSLWFDVGRLNVLSDMPVMEVPNFDYGPVAEGRKGPAEKPSFMKP